MLQRIQSIWLFLAVIAAGLTIKLPFYSGSKMGSPAPLELNATANYGLLGLTIVVAMVAGIAIFMYKNRRTQLRLCALGILLEAILLFLYYREVQTFTDGTYSLTAILHSLIVIFFVLAARGIKKDEQLIRNSDRLR